MTKNIYATLDLNKSLNTFQLNVTKLLDFNELAEWNGKKFQERELEIRNQALILAGQCISIFLYKLSINKKFLDYSLELSCSEKNLNLEKRGYKIRQILTVGNVEVNFKLPYLVERDIAKKKPTHTSNKKNETKNKVFRILPLFKMVRNA